VAETSIEAVYSREFRSAATQPPALARPQSREAASAAAVIGLNAPFMFTAKTLSFLRSLKRNNDRAWFHARREQYEMHVRGPMIDVVERLADDFASFAPEFAADTKISLFRPFRDTRFSENKAPLKTNIAAVFPHRGLGRMNGASLYVEIAPAWVWICGGIYAPDSSQLQAIREHVAAHHAELDEIVRAAGFRKLGGLQGERLTRVPRGFAKEHPAAHFLQQKQFLGIREEKPEFATRRDFYKTLVATFKQFVPLCRFINEPLVARRKQLADPLATNSFAAFAPARREPPHDPLRVLHLHSQARTAPQR
jgi:uncharacterized protein (TIGR02453 family)